DGVQHGDLIDFVDFDFVARGAKINAATLWALGTNPSIPKNTLIHTAPPTGLPGTNLTPRRSDAPPHPHHPPPHTLYPHSPPPPPPLSIGRDHGAAETPAASLAAPPQHAALNPHAQPPVRRPPRASARHAHPRRFPARC